MTRGQESLLETTKQMNFMFLFGAKPGYGVSAETKLIFDIMINFEKFYDKATQTVTFPDIFNLLEGSDSSIEIIQSSMLQLLRLDIKNYLMLQSLACIFVQDHLQRNELRPIFYQNARETALNTREFLIKSLNINKVEILEN